MKLKELNIESLLEDLEREYLNLLLEKKAPSPIKCDTGSAFDSMKKIISNIDITKFGQASLSNTYKDIKSNNGKIGDLKNETFREVFKEIRGVSGESSFKEGNPFRYIESLKNLPEIKEGGSISDVSRNIKISLFLELFVSILENYDETSSGKILENFLAGLGRGWVPRDVGIEDIYFPSKENYGFSLKRGYEKATFTGSFTNMYDALLRNPGGIIYIHLLPKSGEIELKEYPVISRSIYQSTIVEKLLTQQEYKKLVNESVEYPANAQQLIDILGELSEFIVDEDFAKLKSTIKQYPNLPTNLQTYLLTLDKQEYEVLAGDLEDIDSINQIANVLSLEPKPEGLDKEDIKYLSDLLGIVKGKAGLGPQIQRGRSKKTVRRKAKGQERFIIKNPYLEGKYMKLEVKSRDEVHYVADIEEGITKNIFSIEGLSENDIENIKLLIRNASKVKTKARTKLELASLIGEPLVEKINIKEINEELKKSLTDINKSNAATIQTKLEMFSNIACQMESFFNSYKDYLTKPGEVTGKNLLGQVGRLNSLKENFDQFFKESEKQQDDSNT